MSLISKTNPVGIDNTIKWIQEHLWENISWNKGAFSDTDYECYHRAYRNETNSSEIWEVFTSVNDYKEVLYDDTFLATSFFVVSNNVNVSLSGKETTDISIVFQLDLNKLYPTISHRADEEAHREVMNILLDNPIGAKISRLTKGIKNVYTELGYGANKFDDLQPFHVFRIDFVGVKASC